MTVEELAKRVTKLEEQRYQDHDNIMQNKYELRDLIQQAVETGNEKVMKKIDSEQAERKKLESRIYELENKEAKVALERWKAIIMTSISWLVVSLLGNLPYVIKALMNINK